MCFTLNSETAAASARQGSCSSGAQPWDSTFCHRHVEQQRGHRDSLSPCWFLPPGLGLLPAFLLLGPTHDPDSFLTGRFCVKLCFRTFGSSLLPTPRAPPPPPPPGFSFPSPTVCLPTRCLARRSSHLLRFAAAPGEVGRLLGNQSHGITAQD